MTKNKIKITLKKCGVVIKKMTLEQFISELPNNIILIGDFKNTSTKTSFQCKIDNKIWSATPRDIRSGHGCPQCKINKLKNTFSWTNEYFLEKLSEIRNDVDILEEYKGSQKNIKCRCKKCGNIWYVAPCRLLKNVNCFHCSYVETRSGENHKFWNKDITKEERESHNSKRTINPKYYQFWKSVMERDDYTCQLTNDRNCKHVVHHLDGYDKFPTKRLDMNNAITLSCKIHKEFHTMYGYGNNTKEQFFDFVEYLYKNKRIGRNTYDNFVKNFK